MAAAHERSMTTATVNTGFPPAAIYRYDPEGNESHCREKLAYADKDGVLVDTFWGLNNTDPLVRHELTATEADSAEFLSLRDLRPARRYEHFEFYPDGTVFAVSSQHGLRADYFIVPGTAPSRDRIIAQARNEVTRAAKAIEQAQRQMQAASRELARLEDGAADELVAAYTVVDGEVSP